MFSRVLAALRSLYTFDRAGCQVRLSLRQKLPVILLPLLVLWYLVRPAPVAAAATVCVGLLILFSYLWARALARSLHAGRNLRYAALQVGDELEEQVTLVNASILPLVWAELIDHSNLPDYPFSSVRSTGSRSKTEWRTHTVCTRRGVFTLGPWQMRSGDPFGLFLVSHTYVQKNDILVYPPLAPLPARLLPHGQVQGEERPLHQPLRAETQDAFTARPYQPGDPLRHIHWPITARNDVPYVKVFEPEDASTVWLLADLDAAAHVTMTYPPAPSLEGGGADNSSSFSSHEAGRKTAKEDSSLETMILLLASLASELLQQRVAVGLLAYSGADPNREPQVSLPSRSPLHLWDVLRTLALLEPSPHPFKDTLEKARALVGGRDQVLAVTPALSADWLPALHQLNRGKRSLSASVILLDPASFAPEPEATVPVEDAGALAPTSHAEIFAGLLARQGVHTSVVRRGELRAIRGAYGELSRWEFKTLGTGRVVVRHAPRPVQAHPSAGHGEPD
jgi:uncharacterized protein (DUF58 family)